VLATGAPTPKKPPKEWLQHASNHTSHDDGCRQWWGEGASGGGEDGGGTGGEAGGGNAGGRGGVGLGGRVVGGGDGVRGGDGGASGARAR